MDTESLRLIELSDVLELVARRAHSELARRSLRSRLPSTSSEWLNRQRRLLEELGRHLRDGRSRLDLAGLDRPASTLQALADGETVLDGVQLADLFVVADAQQEAAGVFSGYPLLEALAGASPVDSELVAELRRCIGPEGEIRDEAHPRLGACRSRAARMRVKIRESLERVLRGSQARYLIESPYITERSGRSVVPVRRDSQGKVAGIVHGLSGSGATVFVEPLPAVELNNELQLLLEEEADLERQVLRELSEQVRAEAEALSRTLEALAELDELFAALAFGRDYDARSATLADDDGLVLENARHPLLVESLGAEKVVPISVRLDSEVRVLIISGPNTGGKTVALKTIGLMCLLAHCGVPVPAQRSRLPRLTGVWADLGDQQSIALQLSTFSAHVSRLVRIQEAARPPCLVLLDEIGRGTDPASGAALAAAVIEHLQQQGALVVATTHHAELKYLAGSSPGMANAGVQLDPESLTPTYRIEMGLAATSSGLEIARQLGLPQQLLEAAARFRDQGEDRIEDFLNELRSERERVRRRESELQEEAAEFQARRREIEAEAQRRLSRIEKTAERRLEELAAGFRRQMSAYIDGLEDRREAARLKRQTQARELLLKEAFRQKMKAGAEDSDRETELRVGDEVSHALWKTGRLLRLEGDNAVVDVKGKRVTAPRRELRRSSIESERKTTRKLPANVSLEATGGTTRELNLVGHRVEEALAQADKFLDRAVVGRMDEVVIIHGFGTGRLQRALAGFLDGHTHVNTFTCEGATTTVTLNS